MHEAPFISGEECKPTFSNVKGGTSPTALATK